MLKASAKEFKPSSWVNFDKLETEWMKMNDGMFEESVTDVIKLLRPDLFWKRK